MQNKNIKNLMKKSFLILGTFIFVSAIILFGCLSSGEKVEAARENVSQANENLEIANDELTQAKRDSIIVFKQEAVKRISLNKKSIADLKLKISKENKEIQIKNAKKLAELEEKNNSLEKSLTEYQIDGSERWSDFKIEFSNDLDELGKAFQNLTR